MFTKEMLKNGQWTDVDKCFFMLMSIGRQSLMEMIMYNQKINSRYFIPSNLFWRGRALEQER